MRTGLGTAIALTRPYATPHWRGWLDELLSFSRPIDSDPATTGSVQLQTAEIMQAEQAPGPVDLPSFEQVYEEYFGFVWRHAMNRGVPHSAIDDVVQEVFLVVHRKLPEFEGRSSLRTWLAAIVRRTAMDFRRKKRNQPAGEPLEHPTPGDADPVREAEQRAAVKLLDQLLQDMREPQREVFILYEIEEFTAVEIAESLELNENTVRTRLRAARKSFAAGVARHQAKERWGQP